MEKEVSYKWGTEGNLAVIYRVDNLLLFYSKDKDPNFKQGQMLSMKEADKSKPYKAIRYNIDNIPFDAYPLLTWNWGK